MILPWVGSVNWLEGVRDAGDGAFLNAARLIASSAPFRRDASMLLGAAQTRRSCLAIAQALPARPPLSADADWRLAGTWNVVDGLN